MANIIMLPGRRVYQCKVILTGSRPRVWRKFHVPEDYTLHKLHVEKLLPIQPDVRYPACLGGENACPPEDCGGLGGYGNFLRAIRNPAHEEHERMLDWVGGEFDPAAFDLERVNARLKRMK